MVGSAIKMLTSMVAIIIIYDLHPEFGKMANFIFMMGIAAVAAPGVMSGVLMASVGLMESIVGFTPEQVGLLMTFYLALDGYGVSGGLGEWDFFERSHNSKNISPRTLRLCGR